MKRRDFVKHSILVTAATGLSSYKWLGEEPFDVTFFVGADTHFDPPPDSDTYFHIRAMNRIPGKEIWPEKIEGKPSGFVGTGSKISSPKGVILAGDLLDKADPLALGLFRQRYEIGEGDKQINYPVYLGYGNHDLNPHVEEDEKVKRRQMMWDYLEERHRGKGAPVPVSNFDTPSKNYSWDWGKVHLVQTHLFAGATSENQVSSLSWLENDLKKHASDGRPVIVIQHYGFDKWALKWWTEKERTDLFAILKKYNVVAIFAGHNHIAENLQWEGIPVFQVNNAWPEIGKGNKDGNGSFAMMRVTDHFIDMCTCRWKNDEGEVELVAPFYSKFF